MRCLDLLKKNNIGFEYLKQLLESIGYNVSTVNARFSDSDTAAIEELLYLVDKMFYDDALVQLQRAKIMYDRTVMSIQDAFPLDLKDYNTWGQIKKIILFNRILSKNKYIIERYHLLPSTDYSEESLLNLIQYQQSGKFAELQKEEREKEKQEKEAEEKKILDELNGNDIYERATSDIDDETRVMSALRNGYGDALGY